MNKSDEQMKRLIYIVIESFPICISPEVKRRIAFQDENKKRGVTTARMWKQLTASNLVDGIAFSI